MRQNPGSERGVGWDAEGVVRGFEQWELVQSAPSLDTLDASQCASVKIQSIQTPWVDHDVKNKDHNSQLFQHQLAMDIVQVTNILWQYVTISQKMNRNRGLSPARHLSWLTGLVVFAPLSAWQLQRQWWQQTVVMVRDLRVSGLLLESLRPCQTQLWSTYIYIIYMWTCKTLTTKYLFTYPGTTLLV